MTAEPTGPALVRALVQFGRALRQEGLVVGSGQLVIYADAVRRLDPSDMDSVYWAGRICLVSRRRDLATYDSVFRRLFGPGAMGVTVNARGVRARPSAAISMARLVAPQTEAGEDGTGGTLASSAEVLRHKRFDRCTTEELARLQALMSRVRLSPPKRRVRRTRPQSRGEVPDLRRAIRRSLRTQGELLAPAFRARRLRPRRLVLILDISGSMAGYSRALLQFSHTAATASRPTTEVFCFGTRLTRVTKELRDRQPDQALARAAAAVLDWDGGTRIGESLGHFVRTWGRAGVARGAIVVICSDGLERDDPAILKMEMTRLARLAHRIVWVNPLKADPRYQPLAGGMAAALPLIDVFVSGHDLSSLERLAALLPELE